jgi:hypothetical protein
MDGSGNSDASLNTAGPQLSAIERIGRPERDLVEGIEDRATTLAIDMKTDGTLGGAYFCSRDGTLNLLQEIASADMSWVEQLLIQAQPTVILLPARASEIMVQHIERFTSWGTEGTFVHN